jgi:glycosyltransferase involved in cell wall biosynthesis
MKVLHVLNELKPSGAETMLRCAAPFWQAHGVTSELLSTGPEEGSYATALRSAGYQIHHLPAKRSPGFFMQFRNLVRTGGYDVVHQHAEGASYWFGLASLAAGARVVRTVHNNFAFNGNLRWRRALQRRHLAALGVRYVAIAPGVHDNEKSRFGISSELVWNWIDTARFAPVTPLERQAARESWGFSEHDIVLVTVGNCSPVKNHHAVIEALAKLPDIPTLRYLHVGTETNDADERQLAIQLGVSERVTFCGWTEPRPAFAAADLYLMPSLYEGLGLAAVEALSVGLPALLADVDGLRDLRNIIPHLIYAEPDATSIANALSHFCATPAPTWRARAAPYPGLVAERFGVERGVREYVDVYRQAGKTHR